VDRNDDGAIDKDELTAALARGWQAGPDGAPPADAPPQDDQAAGAVTMSLSVTFVSIAVQRYAAVQNAAAPTTTAAAPAPKDSPTAATPAIAA
jgi:hypothetical protein